MFVHPPYLRKPTRGEHDTAEAADEVYLHLYEDSDNVPCFLRKHLNVVREAALKNALLELCAFYDVEDGSDEASGEEVKAQRAIVEEAFRKAHELHACAKQAVVWIESREPHHFEDLVNSKDQIEGALERLMELAGYYADLSMAPPIFNVNKDVISNTV